MRTRNPIKLGVYVELNVLTPAIIQRIGGKLGNPTVRRLIELAESGESKSFKVDVGDGVTVIYPADSSCTLRVECLEERANAAKPA